MSANLLRMPTSHQQQPALNLPGPRVWDIDRLSEYIGMSKSWIYKRCEKGATNPLPRIKRTRLVKVDTWNPKFHEWLDWFFSSDVDTEAGE